MAEFFSFFFFFFTSPDVFEEQGPYKSEAFKAFWLGPAACLLPSEGAIPLQHCPRLGPFVCLFFSYLLFLPSHLGPGIFLL